MIIAQVSFHPLHPPPPSGALIKEKTCRCRKTIPLSCYLLLKGELCSLLSQYSIPVVQQSPSQMEECRSTAERSNPNICLATAEAFSLRQNTGPLCAILLQMVSLFDRGELLHAAAVGENLDWGYVGL